MTTLTLGIPSIHPFLHLLVPELHPTVHQPSIVHPSLGTVTSSLLTLFSYESSELFPGQIPLSYSSLGLPVGSVE